MTAALAREGEVAARSRPWTGWWRWPAAVLAGLGPDPAGLRAALGRAGALVGAVRDGCGRLLRAAAGPPSPS